MRVSIIATLILASLFTANAYSAQSILAFDAQRRLSQHAAVQQSAYILAAESADTDADGYAEPPAFTTGSGPTGGGRVPSTSGAAKADGYGSPLGYCVWDNGSITASTNRIAGGIGANKTSFAVISAGLDNIFQSSCANLATGTLNGDDYALWYAVNQVAAGISGVGSTSALHWGAPVADLATLNGLGTGSLTDGEVRLIKNTNGLYRYTAGTGWQNISSGLWTDTGSAAVISNNAYNVGIGTNTPTVKLDVVGAIQSNSYLNTTNGAATWDYTKIRSDGVTSHFNAGGAESGIAFEMDSVEKMRLSQLGYLGIGTTNPRVSLDVGGYTSGGAVRSVLARQAEGDGTGDGTFLGTRAFGTQQVDFNGKSFSLEHEFYGSTNNAINFYRGGSVTGGYIRFATNNGTEQMVIDANGNVGIGTMSPLDKLNIVGAIRAGASQSTNGTVLLRDNYPDGSLTTLGTERSSGGPLLGYGINASTSTPGVYTSSTGVALPRSGLAMGADIRFITGGSQTVAIGSIVSMIEAMRIKNTGQVGIGTATPSALLHVNGTGLFEGTLTANAGLVASNINSVGQISYTGNYGGSAASPALAFTGSSYTGTGVFSPAANQVAISTNGAQQLVVDATGNVGVGTTQPYGKLHVTNTGWSDQTASPDSASFPTVGTGGFVLDGSYTDGRFRSRFVKVDRGYNLGLYIQGSEGTANAFTNIARFGTHAQSTNTFEVFGDTKINGALKVGGFQVADAGTVAANALQPREREIANFVVNDIHWSSTTGFFIEAHARYFDSGYKKYYIEAGYRSYDVRQIESRGDLASHFGIRIVKAEQTADYGGQPSYRYRVYAQADYYTDWKITINGTSMTMLNSGDANTVGELAIKNSTTLADIATISNTGVVNSFEGKTGFGTTTPTTTLDIAATGAYNAGAARIYGAAGTGLRITDTRNNNQSDFVLEVSDYKGGAAAGAFAINDVKNDATRLLIDNNGNVGIGNTAPAYKLDLATLNADFQTDSIRLSPSNGPAGGGGTAYGGGFVFVPNYTSYTKRSAGVLQTAEGNYFRSGLAFMTNGTSDFTTDWAERMRITSTGNVGIGTSTPISKMHIAGNGGDLLSLTSMGGIHLANGYNDGTWGVRLAGIDNGVTGHNFNVQTRNTSTGAFTNSLTVTSSGNVGVGTTTPTEKLQVAGNGVFGIAGTAIGSSSITLRADSGNAYAKLGQIGFERSYYNAGQNAAEIQFYRGGAGAEGALAFATQASASALTERMRITEGGNVGIGTTAPSTKLTVNSGTLGDSGLRLQQLDGTTVNYGIGSTAVGSTTRAIGVDSTGKVFLTNAFHSLDSRATDYTPSDRPAGLYADFKNNSTNGLNDGGIYNGVLTFRSYGGSTDLSGGYPMQLAYTANGNLWSRMGTSATTWGTWGKFITTANLAGNAWTLGGNTGTDPNNQYVGTTDPVDLSIRTNNIERIRVTSAGRIGINNSNPLAKLDVSDNAAGAYTLTSSAAYTYLPSGMVERLFAPGTTNGTALTVYEVNNSVGGDQQAFVGALSENATSNAPAALVFGQRNGATNWVERMRINSSGNLGIGTTTPSNKLTLATSADGQGMSFESNSVLIGSLARNTVGSTVGLALDGVTGRQISINGTASSNVLLVNGGGNVGIGTTAPAEKLEVNGNVLIRSTNYDAYNSSSPALDIEGAVIRLGDGRSGLGTFTNGMGIKFHDTGVQHTSIAYYPSISRMDFGRSSGSSGSIALDSPTTPTLSLNMSSGNVGIGTNAPTSRLTVTGEGLGTVRTGSTGFGGDWSGISLSGNLNTTDYNFAGSSSNATLFINRPTGGDIDFRVAHSNQMIIKSSGNVGIGVTSPSQKLVVNGDIAFNANAQYLRAYNSSGVQTRILGINAANDLYYGGIDTTIGNMLFLNGTEKMRIDTAGNVGIGTATPTARMEVFNAATAGHLVLSANDASASDSTRIDLDFLVKDKGHTIGRIGSVYYTSVNGGSGGLRFFTRNAGSLSEKMLIDAVGNVGIGTTTPAYKLVIDNGANAGRSLVLANSVADGANISFQNNASNQFNIDQMNSQLRFFTENGASGNVVRMTILETGEVGIGTNAPTTKLNVVGAGEVARFGDTALTNQYISLRNGGTGAGYFGLDTSLNGGNGGYVLQGGANKSLNFVVNTDYFSGATPSMMISMAGNVGIGTIYPSSKLDVIGQTLIGNGDRVQQSTFPLYISDSSNLGWKVANSTGTSKFELYTGYGGLNQMRLLNGVSLIGYSQDLTLGTSTVPSAMTVQLATGNIGVGTTTPTALLDVSGTGASAVIRAYASSGVPSLRLESASGSPYMQMQSGAIIQDLSGGALRMRAATGGFMSFDTNGANERMRIDSSGNLGIGTTAPTAKLDVNGHTRLTTVSQGATATERFYPNVISSAQNNGVTGAWVVHTPIPRTANRMFKIRVHGYWYGVNKIVDFTIVGYPYAATSGNVDSLAGSILATDIIDQGTDGLNKYVGVDAAGNLAIALGDVGSSIYFGRMSVDAWITQGTSEFASGWSIDQNTTAGFGWGDIHGPMKPSANNAWTGTANYIPKFSTAGTLANSSLYDNGSGNIGIGNAAPSERLTVGDGTSASQGIHINAATTPLLRFQRAGTNKWGIIENQLGGDGLDFYSYGATSPSVKFSISKEGNVGIGNTVVASTKLEVNETALNTDVARFNVPAATSGGLLVASPSGWLRMAPNNAIGNFNPLVATGDSSLIFSNNTVDQGNLVIAPWASSARGIKMMGATGNVGIGTASPLEKLDVAGTIRAGNTSSTNGSVMLHDNYADGSLTTLGTERSSGGPLLGYGINADTTTPGNYTSSTGTAVSRSGLAMGTDIRFVTGASQTVAIGSSVSMNEVMRITSAGKVGIGVAAPTAQLSLPTGTTAPYGINFGGDSTNLYRIGANYLATDGSLQINGPYLNMNGGTILLGSGGMSGSGDVVFRSAGAASSVINAVWKSKDSTSALQDNLRFNTAWVNSTPGSLSNTITMSSLGTPIFTVAATPSTGSINFNTNVGIGASSPAAPLHIIKSTQAGPVFMYAGMGTDGVGDNTNGVGMYLSHNGTGNRQFVIADTETLAGVRYINNSIDGWTNGARTDLNLGTETNGVHVGYAVASTQFSASNRSGTLSKTVAAFEGAAAQTGALITANLYGGTLGDKFIVTAAGNVGIGTSTPSGKFEVYGGTTRLWNGGTSYYTAFENSNEINMYAAGGTSANLYIQYALTAGASTNIGHGALVIAGNGGDTSFGGNIIPSTQSNSAGGVWNFGSNAWGGTVSGATSVTGLKYVGGSGSQLLTLASDPGQTSIQLDGSVFAGDGVLTYNPLNLTAASNGYLSAKSGAQIGGNLYVQNTIQASNYSSSVIAKNIPFVIRGTGLNNNSNAIIRLGGSEVLNGGARGLALTIIDKATHVVVSTTTYDTYGNTVASDNLATALNAMTNSQMGVLASFDAWTANTTANLKTAFLRLGLTKAYGISGNGTGRFPYAAIFEASSNGENTAKSTEMLLSSSTNQPYAEIRGWLTDGSYVASSSGNNALFNPIGNTALMVDAAGNIGLGTTSPTVLLDLIQTTANSGYKISRTGQTYQNVSLDLGDFSTAGRLAATSASTNQKPLVIISSVTGGAATPASSDIRFLVGQSGSEAMVMSLQSSGYVGIGTAAPSYPLHVIGTAAATAFNTLSDVRYKQNFAPITGAMATINQLEGVRYDFNRAAFPEMKFPEARQMGFVAQQIEAFVPELVSTDTRGFKSVNYAQMTALLAEGLKEHDQVVRHFKFEDANTLALDASVFKAKKLLADELGVSRIKVPVIEFAGRFELADNVANKRRMVITADGKVGFNVDNPTVDFEVGGDAKFAASLSAENINVANHLLAKNITSSGLVTANSLSAGNVNLTGSTMPSNGLYAPTTNSVGISADSNLIAKFDSMSATFAGDIVIRNAAGIEKKVIDKEGHLYAANLVAANDDCAGREGAIGRDNSGNLFICK